MRKNSLFHRSAVLIGAAAVLLCVGPMASSATAQSLPPISVGRTLQVVLLPPSPCRPSDGGQRCLDVGTVAQLYFVPPSPCAGAVCL